MSHREFCYDLCHRVFCLFSSKSFIVAGPTFRFLIHFEFILEYGITKCSNFILLPEAVQFSKHLLLKRLFSPLYIFAPLSKIRCPCVCGITLSFLSYSIDLYFCFGAGTILP